MLRHSIMQVMHEREHAMAKNKTLLNSVSSNHAC